jgi:hypothetical protein
MVLSLLVAAGAWAAVAVGRGSPPPAGAGTADRVLPPRLAGLPITTHVGGEDAVRAVVELHIGDVPVDGAEVGAYGGGRIRAWVSWAATEPAPELVERMTRRIAEGGTPFSRPVERRPGVWETVGLGRTHVYFAREGRVWWVEADEELLRAALRELLG